MNSEGPDGELVDDGAAIRLTLDGQPFAMYHLRSDAPRPFFDRVLGPGSVAVTRTLPVDERYPDSADHPHHRGIWGGHRAVNGSDFWTEFDGHARVEHQRFEEIRRLPDRLRVRHRLDWLDTSGAPVLLEDRVIELHGVQSDESRMLDLTTTLTAAHGPVTLGDTKEAGLVAVRVAPSMEERHGGRIENATGAIGEAECWGRPAVWCDYSGNVDRHWVGVALMDHPSNLRHPNPWHVRDYGLMAANPFGYEDFCPGGGKDGALRLGAGEAVIFRYRLLLHWGDASAGHVAQRYAEFAAE